MSSRVNKRGVSPVVATILLIAIVIILAVIIFLWARGFVAEKAQKFGRAVELSCDDVNIEAGVFFIAEGAGECGPGFSLDIVNRGDVPLYGIEVKDLSDPGTVIVKRTYTGTVTIGQSDSICLSDEDIELGDQLLLVPVILGESDSGKVAHTCTDNFGHAVTVV